MPEQDLKRWASTTDFAEPFPWGEVEARISAEPGPTAEEQAALEWHEPLRLATWWRLLILAPLVVPLLGSSVIGFAFVLAYVVWGWELSEDLGFVVQAAFGISLVMAVVPIFLWWEVRRREFWNVTVAALIAFPSALSWVLLKSAEVSSLSYWAWVAILAFLAAVIGAVEFVFFVVVAKPPPRSLKHEQSLGDSLEDRWLKGQRAIVLEQLRKRGLVADTDSVALMDLPRDTWRELETLPDGRVVRRAR